METEIIARQVRQLQHIDQMLEVVWGEHRAEYIEAAKRLMSQVVLVSESPLSPTEYFNAIGLGRLLEAIRKFDNRP